MHIPRVEDASPIPEELRNRVLAAVEECIGRPPFAHTRTGVRVTEELVLCAVRLLNAAPSRCLPLLPSNTDTALTPEGGLDRALKEHFGNGTRRADTVADVLTSAAIAKTTTVTNPLSGRQVRALRLLPDWSW